MYRIAGFLLVAVLMTSTAVSGKAAIEDLDTQELNMICRSLEREIPVVFPCTYSFEMQMIEIVIGSDLYDFTKDLAFRRACKLATSHFFNLTEQYNTIWTLRVYTVDGGPPVGVCDLSYVKNSII